MSCAILTNKDKELLKYLPEETEETLKGLIGIWMERNPKRKTDHPTLDEIKSLISQLRGSEFPQLISPTIENYSGNWTRGEAARDLESLYIFTDNTDRDSGRGLIDPISKYAQKYGQGKHYPTMTQAVLRGLDNAMPLSTQRWYHEGAKGVSGRWTDADFSEFKKVIDAEIEDIVKEWSTGKYKRIVIGSADGFFNTRISNISMERTPRLYQYLQSKLGQIGIKPTRVTSNQSASIIPKLKGKMNFAYGNQRADGVTASTTLEAIKRGERTATTRYTSDGNIDYWKQAKVGDVIEFSGQNGEKVLVRVTKELHQLPKSTTAEEWSSKEGWDTSRFEQSVKPQIEKGEAYQMEFEYIDDFNEALQMLDDALLPPAATQKEQVTLDTTSFETQRLTSLKAMKAVDLVTDPVTRRDRVTLISRWFSDEIDRILKEKEDTINRRMMEEELTEVQKNYLRKELRSLDRFKVIEEFTPGGIFIRVKGIFEDYLNATEEERVQAELAKINATKGAEKYSDERKLAAAKKRATYKTQEYQKVVDYFRPLAEEASGLLLMTEGIRVNPDYMAPEDANFNEDDPEGYSELDAQTGISAEEEKSYKDGWMTSFKHVSSHESLSQAIRKVIREIPRLDYRGKYDKDDLGHDRYLDASYVHATLIDKLRHMITSEDMIPLLEDLSRLKPWVKQVIKTINKDDSLFSQFYQDFRKDFLQYWIQKKTLKPDGTYAVETIPINKPEGVYYLLDSWRDNYESGTLLDEDSIYEKNGEVNKKNASEGLSIVESLNNQFQKQGLTTQERLDLLEQEETWNSLIKVLNMAGIDINPATLRAALTNIRTAPGIEFTDPILLLLPQLNIIFDGTRKGKVKSEILEDDTVKRGDLINTFGSAYNAIASMLAEVTEDAIESSSRENDKSYYAHVNPSYMGKLIKQLKNVMNNKERFDKFIQDEFKQYEWFFKDGRWRSDWIEKLATDPSMRKALQHKVLLNHNKIPYQDWDDLNYTIVLLHEYWAEPKEKMAWYHVPNLSDSPSAEFIRFVRYTTGSEEDEQGNKKTYQDIILDKMIDIVNQEYDRIQLVKERDAMYRSGANIAPIANFDIPRDSKGDIKKDANGKEILGGAEFKFIPELNDYKDKDGEKFLDKFERLRNESPSKFSKFLRDTLNEIMDKGFESTYSEWHDIGLFDELDNGRFKHIPFQGQSQTNQKVVNSLKEAQKVLGDLFTPDMWVLLNKYDKNKAINDKQANAIFDQIIKILNDKELRGEIKSPEKDAIVRNLNTKNNSKDALREYYWNSKFATSQIIQMTTTDLAFYKDMEDFQKRYKEVHAPSLRLNTMAKFNGETIGRTWERTIYLADDEIVSSTIADIKEIFDAKISKGEMTAIERDYILSQFKKVNVADAQAYRSLSSYRAMMGMMGQWTNEMETAYKHLTDPNGKWTMEDFNIIWQTKKPYVYTQVNNDSGVGGHTGIKTPVQHKNSEFLLLALHDAIAGPLGKSGKLKAINDFMEKNQIDVVQFESTTKVGKQGVINLNDEAVKAEQALLRSENKPATEQDAVKSILGKTTGIAQKAENPNVVHKVSYEDYGIQTATPEHAIDAVQLVGTQIRKLITADMADYIQITIGDKTMTKAEWLKTYNAINTENILQAFLEVDAIFQDPKKVEEILLEELRGNPRYGIDMIRACTLNEYGQFNIPLYDPVQSQRVQTLLNSIIKSRVTKQKIKGGSLIQVSAYGVTDQLKIVYEGKGVNKRVKYLECYMPAYSREFYEPLMGEDGKLDISKLPENLRKAIGYRV